MASTGKSRLPLSLRRPRTLLVVALVLIVVLGFVGRNVESKLNPTSLDVPGTDSNRATKLLKQYFGDSAPFAILLQGPKSEIEEQGPALVHALRASDPKVTTVSPWDKGKVGNLRPAPNKALILADFHVNVNDAVRYTVDELNEILEEKVTPPVQATQTGFATLSRAIQDESIAASERSELIALPILLLVLLLVFRSPGRGPDPALLRGDHGDHLARGPGAALRDDLDRRLRARRQHDDGVSPGRGLRPADGLALPRRARQRRRAVRGRRDDPQDGRGGRPSSPAAPCSWRWSSRSRSCPARCSSRWPAR